MNYVSGTGATLAGSSLEEYCYLLIKFGQQMEADVTKNTNTVNLITSGTNDDDNSFTASLSNFPLLLREDGTHTAIDYLSLLPADFTNGTGGDFSSLNTWTDTLWTVLIKLHNQQLLSTEERDNFSYSVESGDVLSLGANCSFSAEAQLSISQEQVTLADGTTSYQVKVKALF